MKTVSDRPGAGLPAPVYLDASALAKLYLPEPESDALNALLRDRDGIVVSDMAITEVVSALSRRRREGHVDAVLVGRVQGEILRHVASGVYQAVELTPTVHREAERLLQDLDRVRLRAADALHLALARASRARAVATYDLRMAEAARAAGFALVPDVETGPRRGRAGSRR